MSQNEYTGKSINDGRTKPRSAASGAEPQKRDCKHEIWFHTTASLRNDHDVLVNFIINVIDLRDRRLCTLLIFHPKRFLFQLCTWENVSNAD